MAQTKSASNRKRSANSKLQTKPAKALKTQPVENHVEKKQEEGLFDNLDEEMDPNEVEDIVNNLNGDSESEEDVDKEDENEDEELEDAEQISDDDEDKEHRDKEELAEDDKEEDAPVFNEQQSTTKKFRDLYMTKVTQAFGTDLDQIRQEPNFNGPRLNILIDSLEAGIDIFSNLEQEIILADEKQ
ncbi:uncharacterized protein ATC70_009055 [Mucor velutinosus]|uniref:Ribosome assembly protein 3 n=1 Tax=Mucor velutinosus TaxID=708070 RepID=A0AAN7DPE7_9FUNG|nr:hypothetical protein ATC70_009055 [Mucor velutinosus]